MVTFVGSWNALPTPVAIKFIFCTVIWKRPMVDNYTIFMLHCVLNFLHIYRTIQSITAKVSHTIILVAKPQQYFQIILPIKDLHIPSVTSTDSLNYDMLYLYYSTKHITKYICFNISQYEAQWNQQISPIPLTSLWW